MHLYYTVPMLKGFTKRTVLVAHISYIVIIKLVLEIVKLINSIIHALE